MKYNETVRFFFSQGQTDTNAKREAIGTTKKLHLPTESKALRF